MNLRRILAECLGVYRTPDRVIRWFENNVFDFLIEPLHGLVWEWQTAVVEVGEVVNQ